MTSPVTRTPEASDEQIARIRYRVDVATARRERVLAQTPGLLTRRGHGPNPYLEPPFVSVRVDVLDAMCVELLERRKADR